MAARDPSYAFDEIGKTFLTIERAKVMHLEFVIAYMKAGHDYETAVRAACAARRLLDAERS